LTPLNAIVGRPVPIAVVLNALLNEEDNRSERGEVIERHGDDLDAVALKHDPVLAVAPVHAAFWLHRVSGR